MRRRLGQIERVMWATEKRRPYNILMAFHVRGGFSLERLRQAVSAARQVHPLVGVRIRHGLTGLSLTTDGVADPPVSVLAQDAGDDWEMTFGALLRQPFDLAQGPLVKLAVRPTDDGFDLVILCHHSISDGLSIVALARELMRQLTPPVQNRPPVAAPALDSLLFQAARAGAESAPAKAPPAPAPDRVVHKAVRTGQQGDFNILLWTLSEADTTALARLCRAEGTTVHAGLCAIFAQAFADMDGKNTITIRTPFNLRYLLPGLEPDAFGLYSLGCDINISTGGDIWHSARGFKGELDGHTTLAGAKAICRLVPTLRFTPATLLRGAVAWAWRHPGPVDFAVSNMGRLDVGPTSPEYQITALLGVAPNIGTPEHPTMAVGTVGGAIHFTVASCDRPRMEVLRDKSMARLAELIGASSASVDLD